MSPLELTHYSIRDKCKEALAKVQEEIQAEQLKLKAQKDESRKTFLEILSAVKSQIAELQQVQNPTA